jgi:hypothetical protein
LKLRVEVFYHQWNLPQKALILLGLAILMGFITRVFENRFIKRVQIILLGSCGLY